MIRSISNNVTQYFSPLLTENSTRNILIDSIINAQKKKKKEITFLVTQI